MALLFIQCSKNDDIKTNNTTTPKLSAYDLKINSMVAGFKDKLKSNLKSGETMSTDSALWYINTTINATYANSYNDGKEPEKTYFDSVKVALPENNGMLTLEQINDLYNKIIDSVRVVYYKISESDKQLCAVIFEPRENSSNPELDMKVVTYSTWGLRWWEQFASTESYYFGWSYDNGNPAFPNACEKFASKFASHVLGNPLITLNPRYSYYWVYTEQHSVTNYSLYPYNFNPNVYPNYTNYLDFYLFENWALLPGYHQTLCADELNFYFSKINEFADVILPQDYNITITPNHRCYTISVGSGRGWCGPDLVSISQGVTFYYGNRVAYEVPNPPL